MSEENERPIIKEGVKRLTEKGLWNELTEGEREQFEMARLEEEEVKKINFVLTGSVKQLANRRR